MAYPSPGQTQAGICGQVTISSEQRIGEGRRDTSLLGGARRIVSLIAFSRLCVCRSLTLVSGAPLPLHLFISVSDGLLFLSCQLDVARCLPATQQAMVEVFFFFFSVTVENEVAWRDCVLGREKQATAICRWV